MSRRTWTVALPLIAVLGLTAAFAGGWATITVENLPDYVIARQPTNLTFSVRQHGMRLMDEVSPSIEARSGDNAYEARAVPTNRAGYYTAKLDLPATGQWAITIKSGWGASNVTLLPIAAVESVGRVPVTFTAAQRGHRLFVAKGCLSCHTHARVAQSGQYEVAPDLTERGLAGDYLARFLADPSVKKTWTSEARMPNLNLKPAEINALVAFLNGH